MRLVLFLIHIFVPSMKLLLLLRVVHADDGAVTSRRRDVTSEIRGDRRRIKKSARREAGGEGDQGKLSSNNEKQ